MIIFLAGFTEQVPVQLLRMDIYRRRAVGWRVSMLITFVNYPTTPHTFDIMDDSERSREIIRQILSFIHGFPVGISCFGAACSEPTLIKLAYAFEQATRHRRAPGFLPTLASDGS